MTDTDPELSHQTVWDLDFEVGKSIRYHAYRRGFWERLDNLAKILTAASGTAVLVSLVGDKTTAATVFAALVTAFSIGDVVFGFSDKARRHDALYRDFGLLAQKIVDLRSPTEEEIRPLRRRRLEIEMDEPGILDWLERRCAAEECKARGCEVKEAWHLNRAQVALSQWAWWPPRIV
jgi:hypothetical protein